MPRTIRCYACMDNDRCDNHDNCGRTADWVVAVTTFKELRLCHECLQELRAATRSRNRKK